MTSSNIRILLTTGVFFLMPFATLALTVIASAGPDTPLVRLATREVQRYLYLLAGEWAEVSDRPAPHADIVLFVDATLGKQEYRFLTTRVGQRKLLHLKGGTDQAVLYAAYHLAEKLGARFYLHGDELPAQQTRLKIPELDEIHRPLFERRGIQPFHDFTEGPDWWEAADYQSYFAQLAKMRMNFAGFHCYPEGGVGPEPLIWIGQPDDIRMHGQVGFSYPSRWASTLGGTFGYASTPTGGFAAGSSLLFENDDFGPSVTAGNRPIPSTPEACNDVFARTGQMLGQAFGFGRRLGIRICIGTETPLAIPKPVQNRLQNQGLDPKNPEVVSRIYEGMFQRIQQCYPVDYYWLWTPEDWTWSGNKAEQLANTIQDIQAAQRALEKLGHPFILGTCGWVLGPQNDRAALDKVLRPESPMSCINRNVGFDFVEPAFSRLEGRPKWAIPWMEDDPNMICPQLWVGRNRRDAADALAYRCTGLMGIHWRTKILSANIASLAQAGWRQTPWNPKPGERLEPETQGAGNVQGVPARQRDLDASDFYEDWTVAQFGNQVDGLLTQLFVALDGGIADYSTNKESRMPRPSDWIEGPGGIKPNPRPWAEEQSRYLFVSRMELLRQHIKGPANLARFDYWLNTFRYLRSVGQIGCTRGQLDTVIKEIENEKDPARQKQMAAQMALPVRLELARQWEIMMTHLLQTVSTPGELGTIANLEQHSRRNPGNPPFLSLHDKKLAEWSGQPLPPESEPAHDYLGPPRLIVPTSPTLLPAGEKMSLKIIVLDRAQPRRIVLFWRPLGKGRFRTMEAQHVARSVYRVDLPSLTDAGLECYVRARSSDRQSLVWPPSAPKINHTVVALPAGS